MVLEVVRRAVHLGDPDVEILSVGPHLILEKGYRYGLTKQQRIVGVAAPVDSGVYAVAECDVVRKLMQFTIHGELVRDTLRIWLRLRAAEIRTMSKLPNF